MNVLVRNSEHVSECVLFEADGLSTRQFFERPEVKNLVGGRKVIHYTIHPVASFGDPLTVDLDLREPW